MIFLFSLMIAVAEPAKLERGAWRSSGGEVQIQFHGMDFVKVGKDGKTVDCKTIWPLKSPQATSKCSNGEAHKLYFDLKNGIVIFDETPLTQSQEALD